MSLFYKVVPLSVTSDKPYQHCMSHYTLRNMLYYDVFSCNYQQELIHIHKDAFGKPWARLDGLHLPVAVSISHTKNYILVAATQEYQYIGVDVEEIRSFSQTFIEEFLCSEEKVFLRSLSINDVSLYMTKIWCLKESVVKAIGSGLRIVPKKIDVTKLINLKEKESSFVVVNGDRLECTLFLSQKSDDHFFVGIALCEKLAPSLSLYAGVSKEYFYCG